MDAIAPAEMDSKAIGSERPTIILFAAGFFAIGAISLISKDFALDWQPVPAFPGRSLAAVLCGIFSMAVSIALLFRSSRKIAVRALLSYLLAWQCLRIPVVVRVPQIEGVWIGFGEIGMLLAGVLVIFARYSAPLPASDPSAFFSRITGREGFRLAQIIFGLAIIPVGLGHLFYRTITASLIPSWMPFRMFLACFTGVAQIVCGMAILFRFFARLAALVEAAMLALFAFLVWGPNTWIGSSLKLQGQPPGYRFPLTAFLITWVIAAAALLIAESSGVSD